MKENFALVQACLSAYPVTSEWMGTITVMAAPGSAVMNNVK